MIDRKNTMVVPNPIKIWFVLNSFCATESSGTKSEWCKIRFHVVWISLMLLYAAYVDPKIKKLKHSSKRQRHFYTSNNASNLKST